MQLATTDAIIMTTAISCHGWTRWSYVNPKEGFYLLCRRHTHLIDLWHGIAQVGFQYLYKPKFRFVVLNLILTKACDDVTALGSLRHFGTVLFGLSYNTALNV